MKFIRAAVVLVALSAVSVQAAADPSLLGLIMPDAKSIAGVQLEQSRNSPLGQFILTQMGPAPFEDIKNATGFDPRTDLTEIVTASAGPTQMLLVGRGVFQPARLVQTVAERRFLLEDGNDQQVGNEIAGGDGRKGDVRRLVDRSHQRVGSDSSCRAGTGALKSSVPAPKDRE